ncbi:genetic suppressor element 1-like isoform X2 [Thalassophryne amazonica]|nr:genetic suppressor element 1-like isoform X2 [Thalassophryne amazonica]XP_034032591.1 genetic suppressor element 1-like isoform X2 [Thalassophryne amazonica]
MNHESNKSPSLGMISTATRTTATVSPLSPLTNGNAVTQSANSGFAAALRKLAKQAEDPRGSALSGKSSPVLSPTTSHTSPVSTPKRGSLAPLLGQTRGHSVSSTPPVVTIAPTKTSNGIWRVDGRQAERGVQTLSRERVGSDGVQSQQGKRTPVPSPHPLAHSFGITPSAIMQDPRIQSLSLPSQMHPVVPSGAIPEEYLRGLRPFATSDDIRLTSLPLSVDPAAAHAAAYYHPAYLHHPLTLPRMEESLCLSALQSQFYSVPGGGSFPPLHPSALHLHLPRYHGELNHTALAERLQMENELRQRERDQEREREKEREREVGLEREREREKEEERERELDRQKERQRERQQQMVRSLDSHYLVELQAHRALQEDRARPGKRLTPNRPDKPKEPEHLGFQAPKPLPLQPGLHPPRSSIPHPVPSLVPAHLGKHHPSSVGGIPGALATAMMTQRVSEEAWLIRQRGQGQERESPLELGLRSPGKVVESRRDSQGPNCVNSSVSKDAPITLGAPPPLISPKALTHPPPPPTTLWNPASLVDTIAESRRKFTSLSMPIQPPPGLTRADRPLSWGESLEEGRRMRSDGPDRYAAVRGAISQEAGQEKNIHNLYHRHHLSNLQQRCCVAPSISSICTELAPSLTKERQSQVPDSTLVYDEILQQHRRLLSKLDLEEKRRREAREGGYYYDLDESYDESDEEEVKAHFRRVTEQPPLKLDTSSEKMDFLHLCDLTTLAHHDELLLHKKRKRRKMMRERSLSPPAVQGKKPTSSPLAPITPLRTPYTAEQMDNTPTLEEKKDFLHMFKLSHVSAQQRKEKERTEDLLRAIQRKNVTLDTLRYNPLPPCSSPPALSTGDSTSAPLLGQSNRHLYPDSPSQSPLQNHKPKQLHHHESFKTPMDTQVVRVPPPLTPHVEKAEPKKGQTGNKKPQGVQNGVVASPHKKEPNPAQNGRNLHWDIFSPETFAHHFHQAVLQSTHNTMKNKVSKCVPESTIKDERSLRHNMSPVKSLNPIHTPQHTHINGHYFQAGRDAPVPQDHLSDEDEEDSEEDEEMETPRKWQGIEAIFEAYQEYMDEWSIERQVLHSQCKRLEAQNNSLTRTAEQLSLTMGELVSQRQKVREERDRLQAQLEHFRRCLTLPNFQWGRGQINGYTPR